MKLAWLAAAAVAAPHVARANLPGHDDNGADYSQTTIARDIVVVIPGERTTENLAIVGSITGAAVVAGAIGLYFHLDSRSLSDSISAHDITGKQWTLADQSVFDHAHDDTIKAGVAYGIGSALLIGAIVTFIVTEPSSERRVIHPHGEGSLTPTVVPASGGALLGGAWRF